jgi:hypothetical protein
MMHAAIDFTRHHACCTKKQRRTNFPLNGNFASEPYVPVPLHRALKTPALLVLRQKRNRIRSV